MTKADPPQQLTPLSLYLSSIQSTYMPQKGAPNVDVLCYYIGIRDLDLAKYLCVQMCTCGYVGGVGMAWEMELLQVLVHLPGSAGWGVSKGDCASV